MSHLFLKHCCAKKFMLIFLLLSMIHPFSFSQKKPTKIELIRANTLEFDKHLNKDVRRLIGDVVLKHDSIYMFCDSAYLYSETNNFDAFGSIYINVSDSVDIWGDFLKYNGNTKIAELHYNVKMVDNQTTLNSDHLFYDMNNELAYYSSGGHIVSGNNELTSTIGRYYSTQKLFFFKDSVVLINPEYTIYSDTLKYNTVTEVAYFFGPTLIISDSNEIYCENGWYDTQKDISRFSKNASLKNDNQILMGDSLYYDRNAGYGKALMNVSITDLKENIIIYGHFGEYFEKTENTLVTDSAYMIKIFEQDSLFLHADTLRSFLDTCGEKRILQGYYKVKFFKPDLQGLCDSIMFFFSDSTINMYGKPVIWSEENQITAVFIKLLLTENTIKEMYMQGNAFIVSQEDSLMFNQIKGKDMVGYFKDDKLHKIDVSGNGQTVYYVKEEDDSITGVNVSESSELTIFLEENQVDRIIFRARPNATLYPLDEIPADKKILKDFKWLDYLRPLNRDDIFDWRAWRDE